MRYCRRFLIGLPTRTAPILAVEIVAARARAVSGGRVRAAQLLERWERVVVPARVAERHRERARSTAAAVAGPAAGAVPAAALLGQLVLAAARVALAAFFDLFTWAAFLAALLRSPRGPSRATC